MFRHLRETNGACLGPDDYQDFVKYVRSSEKRVKTVVLYGYIPSLEYLVREVPPPRRPKEHQIRHGDDAANLLVKAMLMEDDDDNNNYDKEEDVDNDNVQDKAEENKNNKKPKMNDRKTTSFAKVNRSYGNNARSVDIVRQDDATGAVTEIACVSLPPLVNDHSDHWIQKTNRRLERLLRNDTARVRVLGRLPMTQKKFNAELNVSHRRIEYLLPLDALYVPSPNTTTLRQFLDSFPSFATTTNNSNRQEDDEAHDGNGSSSSANQQRPDEATLSYLYALKKKMQLFTTHIVQLDMNDQAAVMEKEFHNKKRKRQKRQRNDKKPNNKNTNASNKDNNNNNSERDKKDDDGVPVKSGCNVLRRKRFHNFTPRVMAHEFLAFRRLDRFHHRCTVRIRGHPFMGLSLTGDLFLNGQVRRVVGLWVALVRGLIDDEQAMVECVFDEAYPHLVPAPPAPALGLYATDASYMQWEGKCKAILSPRPTNRYDCGFNNPTVLNATATWEQEYRETIANAWMQEGRDNKDDDGDSLVSVQQWIQQDLEPWAKHANEQVREYRAWKAERDKTTATTKAADQQHQQQQQHDNTFASSSSTPEPALLASLDSVDATVPALFERVLHYLREADSSGLWPTTTPKRQLVMVSTPNGSSSGGGGTTSLSMAHMQAKSNKVERSSAYAYAEGHGGASGSFSVGAMPGDKCIQPKANELFPHLMKAAFELEIALCPHREPSSTIAINRNAQFRPHTDSGAGAGQSTSLIVGLGHYAGGELVVEGERKDIRYKAIEFNGWKQRHWTMPFRGERFSLVWFTPKGCEGVRGIDLCR